METSLREISKFCFCEINFAKKNSDRKFKNRNYFISMMKEVPLLFCSKLMLYLK